MALLNKSHLNAVVSIEMQEGDAYQPIATGFLIGFIVDKNPDPKLTTYRVFLVTNRHVFEGKNQVWLRFNKKNDTGSIRFPVDLIFKDEKKWLAHKDLKVDLAMLTISPQFLNEQNIEWIFYPEEIIAYQKNFEDIGITLGDGIFVLGFPMGLSGVNQNYVLVRSGIISRVDKEIIEQKKSFFVDASIFPGNSGGPILLKPEVSSIQNTKAVSSVYVLGVVSGYIPYKEILYSHQSNPPSFAGVSMENSGLANIVPMDFAKEIYEDWLSSNKVIEKEEKAGEKIVEDSGLGGI